MNLLLSPFGFAFLDSDLYHLGRGVDLEHHRALYTTRSVTLPSNLNGLLYTIPMF